MTPLKSSDPDLLPLIELPIVDKRARLRFENNLFQSVIEKHLTTSEQTARLGDYKLEMFDTFALCKLSKVSKKTLKLAYDLLKLSKDSLESISYDLERQSKLDPFYRHLFTATSLLDELKIEGVVKKKDEFSDKLELGFAFFFKHKNYDKALTLALYSDLQGLVSAFDELLDDCYEHPLSLIETFRYLLFITNALKRRKVPHADDLLAWTYKACADYFKDLSKSEDRSTLESLIKLIPVGDFPVILSRIVKKFGVRHLLRVKAKLNAESPHQVSLTTWFESHKKDVLFKVIKNHDCKDLLSFCESQPFEEIKDLLDAYVNLKGSYPIRIVQACSLVYEMSKKISDEFLSYQIKVWVRNTGLDYGYHLKL